jgi:hypothetical protein
LFCFSARAIKSWLSRTHFGLKPRARTKADVRKEICARKFPHHENTLCEGQRKLQLATSSVASVGELNDIPCAPEPFNTAFAFGPRVEKYP